MKRGGRIDRKPAGSTVSIPPEPKFPSPFKSRNNSLPQIHQDEGGEVETEADFPLNRTPTIEALPAKKGSRPGSKQVTRAIYPCKPRFKGENSVKPCSGYIRRSNSQADISFKLMKGSRHKRSGLSMQLDSDSRFLLNRTDTGIQSLHLSQSFAKSHKSPIESTAPADNMESDLERLKEKLVKALGAVPVEDLRAQTKVYHIHFVEVVRASGQLGKVLEVFQQGYKGLFEAMQEKYTCEVGKLRTEIISLQGAILREVSDRKTFLAKIDKLSRENVEISSTCQSYEEKLSDYQEKLFDIANVTMENYPPSEQAWQVLNSELQYYHTWKRKAERELKIVQVKEKKLIKLVHALKMRGYPVEEVYNADVKTPAASAHSAEIVRDENESQRLVSGRPKSLPKPQTVPSLELKGVEPDISSEEVSIEVPAFELSLGSTHFMTDDPSPIIYDSADHRKVV